MNNYFSNLLIEDSKGKRYCPDKREGYGRILDISFFSRHSLMNVEEEREDGTYKVKQLYVPNGDNGKVYIGIEALIANKTELGRIIVDMEGNEVDVSKV